MASAAMASVAYSSTSVGLMCSAVLRRALLEIADIKLLLRVLLLFRAVRNFGVTRTRLHGSGQAADGHPLLTARFRMLC